MFLKNNKTHDIFITIRLTTNTYTMGGISFKALDDTYYAATDNVSKVTVYMAKNNGHVNMTRVFDDMGVDFDNWKTSVGGSETLKTYFGIEPSRIVSSGLIQGELYDFGNAHEICRLSHVMEPEKMKKFFVEYEDRYRDLYREPATSVIETTSIVQATNTTEMVMEEKEVVQDDDDDYDVNFDTFRAKKRRVDETSSDDVQDPWHDTNFNNTFDDYDRLMEYEEEQTKKRRR